MLWKCQWVQVCKYLLAYTMNIPWAQKSISYITLHMLSIFCPLSEALHGAN